MEGTSQELSPLLGAEQQPLFPGGKPQQAQLLLAEELGSVDLEEVCKSLPRLKKVREITGTHRFLHWELEFADLFEEMGGFDLILGNPPWIKVEWNEGAVLGDVEPVLALRSVSAPKLKDMRSALLERYAYLQHTYLTEYEEFAGSQAYLNGNQNYPLLTGAQSNLYKCFVTQSWWLSTHNGVQAFLHPEGIYNEPGCSILRESLYSRLRYHFHFRNERKLFKEVQHTRNFGVNVMGPRSPIIEFFHLCNLFDPQTVDRCFTHDGTGSVPGIKDDDNQWNTQPHRSRLLLIREADLEVFKALYNEEGSSARRSSLPPIHSQEVLAALSCLATWPSRLIDLTGAYVGTEMWHETNFQDDGILARKTLFPEAVGQMIFSGPHIFVGNPLSKTPREICRIHLDYDSIDLTAINDAYLPRTNFQILVPSEAYKKLAVVLPWNPSRTVLDEYRLMCRKMLDHELERTLAPAIIPPGSAHIHGCFSIAFRSQLDLLNYTATCCSLVSDFFVRTTGKANFLGEVAQQLPVFDSPRLRLRCLLLNCLTQAYSSLWSDGWEEVFNRAMWTKADRRLPPEHFSSLSKRWSWLTPLRSDYARRQALVEMDVLVARSLGLSLNQLCQLYRTQFSVLRHNDEDTWYDQNGRIVFTCSKGLPGVGLSRAEWEKIKCNKSGVTPRMFSDSTLQGAPRERLIEYVAPFDRCNREADYADAWKFFDEAAV